MLTHNDVKIGDRVTIKPLGDTVTICDVLDGWRGIGVTRTGDIYSKDRWFVDIADVENVN